MIIAGERSTGASAHDPAERIGAAYRAQKRVDVAPDTLAGVAGRTSLLCQSSLRAATGPLRGRHLAHILAGSAGLSVGISQAGAGRRRCYALPVLLSSMKERLLSRGPDGFFVRSVASRRGDGCWRGASKRARSGGGEPARRARLELLDASRSPGCGRREQMLGWLRLAYDRRGRVAVRLQVSLLLGGVAGGARSPVIYPPRRWWHGGFRPQPDGLNQLGDHAGFRGS